MNMEFLKELIDFVKQAPMIERKRNEKEGKGDMLPSQLSEDIAHRLNHNGEKAVLLDRLCLLHRFCFRKTVIATEKKIVRFSPLYDDFEGFGIRHKRSRPCGQSWVPLKRFPCCVYND
jgi:hypothetical protein